MKPKSNTPIRKAGFLIYTILMFYCLPAKLVLAQSSQARIKIDIEREIGAINRMIYGNFVEHLGRCIYGGLYEPGSLLSDENGFRKDVISATKKLNVSVVRWPGGNFGAVGVRVGAVGSSDLVRDSIVEPFAVRPQVAPLLGLRAIFPVGDRYLLGAQLAVSRSDLRTVTDTAEAAVTALTVWAPSVVLRTSIVPWLAAEARLGALPYDPATSEGTLFSDGSPVAPMLGLGLALERPLNERFRAALFLEYDAHRFTTTTLGERGFTGATIVHRVAVGLSLTREFGHAAP